MLATDAERFWNPKYLWRIRALGLNLEEILVGNIALCATTHNKYPKALLRTCWERHPLRFLRPLAPSTVIFMGYRSIVGEFVASARSEFPSMRVICMAHYAHREGNACEREACARVRRFLGA